MIDYKEVLNDKKIISIYKEIDKVNKAPYNHGMQHILNVIELMKKLIKVLKLNAKEANKILIACVLHDVGQIDGREKHGIKSRQFAEKYLENKVDKSNLTDILNAIEHHSLKSNFESITDFSSLLLYIDKMDFSNSRLKNNYREKFGHIASEDVEEIDFKLEGEEFHLIINTTKKITVKDFLNENKFFYKVINALNLFANRFKFKPNIIFDNQVLDINKEFMDIAIDISKKAKFPYGAIVVKNNKIIGRSDTITPVSKSAYSHAELVAIEEALHELGGYLCAEEGAGCTIYSSCEPCAMCMGAILYTGIDTLFYAATLEDSKKIVNEILVKAVGVADLCQNRNVKIVSEFERETAIEVLKEWKKQNE